MSGMTSTLNYLVMAAGVASVVLVALVIYGNALDTREDEEIYVNKTEEKMMASDQPVLIRKMNRLARVITAVAITTGMVWLASAGVWVWIGLYKS
jgi:hypothetical protein